MPSTLFGQFQVYCLFVIQCLESFETFSKNVSTSKNHNNGPILFLYSSCVSIGSLSFNATTVLSALNIESINSDIYTIAELADKENKIHMENADVDEIIVNNDISTKMLIRSAVCNGVSGIIDELIDNEYGTEIYYKKPEEIDINNNYFEVLKKYKQKFDYNIIGIKREKNILLNPKIEEKIKFGDELIYLGVNN